MSFAKLVDAVGLYSPLIVIIGVWIVTLFSNEVLKGVTYIFLIIFALVLRIAALKLPSNPPTIKPVITLADGSIKKCSMETEIAGDNETLGVYVISYTMWYICLPMFLINDINWGLFSFFLAALIMNMAINRKCIEGCMPSVITNLIVGGLLGTMYSLGVYTYANSLSMINESSSSAEVCSAPSKQTFKCKVFKNGEQIGETVTGKAKAKATAMFK